MAHIFKKEDSTISMSFNGTERIQWMGTEMESGRISLRFGGDFKAGSDEAAQYLTPSDAMSLSKSLKALALKSFEDLA